MTPQEIKAKVLEQYSDAGQWIYRGDQYSVKNFNPRLSSDYFLLEIEAWQDFYEKYCTKQPTNMKQLTRSDFEGLEVGTEITTLDNRVYKFNHIVNDLVFMINSDNKASIVPIDYMNQHYFTIQKPKQYNHLGWEIGDYSGKNVWVKVKDSEEDTEIQAVLLKEVTECSFIDSDDYEWKYAVQLTDINNNKMCDETKK